MIVKSLSRKATSGSTGQLLGYIFRYVLDKEKRLPAEKPFIIKHNIRSRTVEGFVKEFEKNERNRIHKRSDQVSVNHTILSWAKVDKGNITDKILKDIAKQFIGLRGENNLFLGTKHEDKDHIHLHLAVSATQLNGLSSRMSRQQFSELKITLDAYQKEKYPQLTSLPRHGLSKEIGLDNIVTMPGQTGRMTQKETLQQALDKLVKLSVSKEQILEGLRSLGHEPYYRAGKLTGIKFDGETKYRLNRFGYDEKKLNELNAVKEKEAQELAEMRMIRERSQEQDKDREHDQEEEPEIDKPEDIDNTEDVQDANTADIETEEEGVGDVSPEDDIE